MKLLRWITKPSDVYVLVCDKDEEFRAYYYLFTRMNDAGYYDNSLEGEQSKWYAAAMQGDRGAARKLLRYRSNHGYENETVYLENVVIP